MEGGLSSQLFQARTIPLHDQVMIKAVSKTTKEDVLEEVQWFEDNAVYTYVRRFIPTDTIFDSYNRKSCRIVETLEIEGVHLIVFEQLGPSLREVLDQPEAYSLSSRQIREIALQVTLGVSRKWYLLPLKLILSMY